MDQWGKHRGFSCSSAFFTIQFMVKWSVKQLLEVAKCVVQKCGGSKLVWRIADKLKMGIPSVVAGNAKSAIIALLPTNEWKSADPSGRQKDGHASNFLVIKS